MFYSYRSFLFVFLALVSTSERAFVNADFKNCKQFDVIPESSYDKDSSSVEDPTKRPNGFMYGTADYPTTSTNLINPCVYLKNLTGRSVEVKAQTLVHGSKICVKDDGGNSGCGTSTLSHCWEAHSDTVKYEFYCDPAKGCESAVQFWLRLKPSVGDPDDWCVLMLKDDYPQSLRPIPNNMPTQPSPTSDSSLTSSSHFVVILTAFVCYFLHILTH